MSRVTSKNRTLNKIIFVNSSKSGVKVFSLCSLENPFHADKNYHALLSLNFLHQLLCLIAVYFLIAKIIWSSMNKNYLLLTVAMQQVPPKFSFLMSVTQFSRIFISELSFIMRHCNNVLCWKQTICAK